MKVTKFDSVVNNCGISLGEISEKTSLSRPLISYYKKHGFGGLSAESRENAEKIANAMGFDNIFEIIGIDNFKIPPTTKAECEKIIEDLRKFEETL